MPEFRPFIGTRYDPSLVSPGMVVAPPYDVISNEYRDELYDRDPYNVIRLELSRDDDPYTSAHDILRQWKQAGILKEESAPAFYVYSQIFKTPQGEEVTRTGVLGALRLSDYANKEVLPHERTLSGPKKDRLALMEATTANLSPIFGLVSDPSFMFDQTLELAMVNPSLLDIEEQLLNGESVRHILWKLDDPSACDRIEKIVGSEKVIIADGHHRYETAMLYRDAHPEIPAAAYIMIFLTNLQSSGTVILPTHRLLHDVQKFEQFELLEKLRERFSLQLFDTREEAVALLNRNHQAITVLEFAADPRWVLILDEAPLPRTASLSALPAMRIQEEIIKPILGVTQEAIDAKSNILYPHTLEELDDMRESQPTDVAFILRPVDPQELAAIVEQGEFMPQKSTFFYPKLLTGLVFHEFESQKISRE